MMISVRSLSIGIVTLGAALTLASAAALAGAKKVPLVDACLNIDSVFCMGGTPGESDVPQFISGFVIFNPRNDGGGVLTVMIKGSVADTDHEVFSCPGAVGAGGYSGCESLGFLLTNRRGHGTFHMEWDDVPDTIEGDHAIGLNTTAFATILANCGDIAINSDHDCTAGGVATEASIQPTGE